MMESVKYDSLADSRPNVTENHWLTTMIRGYMIHPEDKEKRLRECLTKVSAQAEERVKVEVVRETQGSWAGRKILIDWFLLFLSRADFFLQETVELFAQLVILYRHKEQNLLSEDQVKSDMLPPWKFITSILLRREFEGPHDRECTFSNSYHDSCMGEKVKAY
eukprot:747219-Hanusia_phi.AAC.8